MDLWDGIKGRILVVEDEPDIRKTLEFAVRSCGYEVHSAENGKTALYEIESFLPDLVLLDIMLPDMSGLEICQNLRSNRERKQSAIIILSARTEETDRVVGFELGADDYVPKPFSVRELLLRIEARLKSRKGEEIHFADPLLKIGDLRVDEQTHQVFVGNKEIHLSVLEMRFLIYLLRSPNKLCTRQQVLTAVWGYHPDVTSRTVDTHIKRIRDKLGSAADLVQTVRGVGFRLALPKQHPTTE